MLNVMDEFTWLCLTNWVARKLDTSKNSRFPERDGDLSVW